ncbi:MAG: hypothetical protein WC594_06290 [Thermodesulfovibrionales bacterium]
MDNYVQRRVFIINPLDPIYMDKWFLTTTEANAFIAKNILCFSSEISTGHFTVYDHEKLTLFYHHLESDLHYLKPTDPDAYKWTIRASNVQYHYQRVPSRLMGRYLLIIKTAQNAAEINNLCKEATGISFEEIIIIGIMIYSLIRQNGAFDMANLLHHSFTNDRIVNALKKETIDKYLALYAITEEDFRSECRKWAMNNKAIPLYKKYEFNPLWSFPIVRTKSIESQKQYISPSLVDLLYASTEGGYFKIMDIYRGRNSNNTFSTKFGESFEDYVGYLLRESLKNVQIRDDSDGSRNPYKADFLLETESTSDKVLIEVKKGSMKNLAKAAVGNELEHYIEKLAKIIYDQLFSKSLIAKSRCHLLVSLEEWYCFEEKVKPLIVEKLEAIAWDKGTDISQFKFHLLGCTSFEIMCQFLKEKPAISIFTLFETKESEAKWYFMSTSHFLKESYLYNPESLTMQESEYDAFWDLLR